MDGIRRRTGCLAEGVPSLVSHGTVPPGPSPLQAQAFNKIVECESKVLGRAAEGEEAQLVFDVLLAARNGALAAEVVPLGEELVVVVEVEVEWLEVEVVIEG